MGLSYSERHAERPETEHLCTEAEALGILKRERGANIWIRVDMSLPIDGEPGMAFPGYQPIRVTRAQAQRFIEGVMFALEKRGARLRLYLRPSGIWIG